jgi:hypothetical protein
MKPACQNARARRACLVAATSRAVACGLAAAVSATAAGTPAAAQTAGGSRVRNNGAFVGTVGEQAGRAGQWNNSYNGIRPLLTGKIFYGTGAGFKPPRMWTTTWPTSTRLASPTWRMRQGSGAGPSARRTKAGPGDRRVRPQRLHDGRREGELEREHTPARDAAYLAKN